MELTDLMEFRSDMELQLDDGTLPANSVMLGAFSSVFRAATEAHTAGEGNGSSSSSSSSSSSKICTIPLEGLTKEEWLEVAEFLYPVRPQPEIEDWKQAEFLLEVATKYDLQLLLHKVDLYLDSHASDMTKGEDISPGSSSVLKWLKAADKSGLEVCLPAIAKQAVAFNRAALSSADNLAVLSVVACRAVIAALIPGCSGYGLCANCKTNRLFRCAQCGR